jgi:cytochrome c biogenesis protein CcdA
MVTGVAVGWLGAVASEAVSAFAVCALSSVIAIGLVLIEIVRRRAMSSLFSSHWQVPQHWALFGRPWYEMLFGGALGLGFVTVVPFVGYYLLLLCILANGDTSTGAVAMFGFGLGRSIPMLTAPFIMASKPATRTSYEVAAAGRLNRWARSSPALISRVIAGVAALEQLGALAIRSSH